MNDTGTWAQASEYYEELRVVVNMNKSKSWAYSPISYEQL